MARSPLWLRVGGIPLATIGPWAGLKYSTLAAGGCGVAEWTMQLPPTFGHPALLTGRRVEIRAGSKNLYAGVLAEPDNASGGWTFSASGLYTLGGSSQQRGFLCFDADGNTTSVPDTAIDTAIANGLPWTRPTSLSAVAFVDSDATDPLTYLGDLLDLWATSTSQRWGVNPDAQVYAAADPADPVWQMTPGTGRFGLADADYASDVYVRYRDSSTTFATAHAGDPVAAARFGTVQYAADLTGLGILTVSAADGIAAGLLAAGKARLGYTNSLSPGRFQLTSMGGTPAVPWLVRGGQKVRLHGVPDTQGQPTSYIDFVIGEAAYDVDADQLTLTPVDLVARSSFDDLVARLLGPA